MELFPENLGPELEAEIRSERTARKKAFRPQISIPLPQTIGTWLLMSSVLMILFWWMQFLGVAVFFTFSTFFLFCIFLERALRWSPSDEEVLGTSVLPKTSRQPLLAYEIQDLQRFRHDPLLRTYLDLAVSIVSAATPDAEAVREIRNALQALGTTVLALPADDPKTVTDDPLALHEEATDLERQAQMERDAVIRASLLQRSESLTRRAETATRTLLLLRRNQALRQETAEQIDALKTSLTAFRVGGRQSAPELADLAASIQRVAHEANAITAARAEVDTLVTEPYRTMTGSAPDELQQVHR